MERSNPRANFAMGNVKCHKIVIFLMIRALFWCIFLLFVIWTGFCLLHMSFCRFFYTAFRRKISVNQAGIYQLLVPKTIEFKIAYLQAYLPLYGHEQCIYLGIIVNSYGTVGLEFGPKMLKIRFIVVETIIRCIHRSV